MRAGWFVVVVLLSAGCLGAQDAPPSTTSPPVVVPDPAVALSFDGESALDLVADQVLYPNGSVRYRVPGSLGNDEVAAWIAETAAAANFSTSFHAFNATYGCETVAMHNVVAERTGTSGRIVMFGAHYDTRPIADKDPDAARRGDPIAGANDGGSGVAVLLELARVLSPSNDTVRLVFFDGEDGGGYKGNGCTDWILGSRAYAASLSQDEVASVRAFVLVDMVGDRDLVLPREASSTPALQDAIYAVGRALGYAQFSDLAGISIIDDHAPFLERGIPSVDLIHTVPNSPKAFPESHHTHADNLENVSAASLEAVGRTLEAWFAGLD